MAKPDVFISYSHQEDRQWVATFRQMLESEVNRRSQHRVTFWRDEEIRPGDKWESEMLGAASSAKVLVVLVSPRWLNSAACQKELSVFQGVSIVSALTLNVRASLPETLARYQWEEFFSVDEGGVERTFIAHDRGEFKRAIESIAAAIARLLALPARPVLERGLEVARTNALPILNERCGSMRILDMEQPIASDAIYTSVNILERLTGRRRKSLTELKAELRLDDFGRFGMAEAIEKRLDAEEVASKHRRLLLRVLSVSVHDVG